MLKRYLYLAHSKGLAKDFQMFLRMTTQQNICLQVLFGKESLMVVSFFLKKFERIS